MMSKKRNNVDYIKPEDPKFLQQLKAQIGYQSGPTIDTKRQKFDTESDSGSDLDEEGPQVVVLKKGDLTAEEAKQEQNRLEKEENEKPADLSQRIVFKSKKLENPTETISESTSQKKDKKRPSRPEISTNKLSFQVEDDEEEEEDED